MNCQTLFFICTLLTLIVPSMKCQNHSLSKRKASPLFHLLFPNRKRPRKPVRYKLITSHPNHFVGYKVKHKGRYPPAEKPRPYQVDQSYPERPYKGPNHIPHKNNFDYNPPEWFEADEYGNPHGDGHFDFEGFGPFDEEDYKNKNPHYEEPSNYIPPKSPPPHVHKFPIHPSQSSYSSPHSPHSGPHPSHPGPHSPHSGPHFSHSGPHPPHSGPYPPPSGPHPPHSGPYPSQHTPHQSPPNNINEINHVHFHIMKIPPKHNNGLKFSKPVKFPMKQNNVIFNTGGHHTGKKNIQDILKEPLFYGEYPIKNIVITKESEAPVLFPAGVNGLDPNTLDFIKHRVQEYSNRNNIIT